MSKSLIGIVTSDKPNKTIIVTVQTRKTHPIYRKQYAVSKHFAAHDEKNEAAKGDRVMIVETRPISATKRFKLEKIIERPTLNDDDVKAVTDTEASV
ncbi:MAG TPA: 30S ribosomal protein S17 [Candidatus Saccharimonadales bacterium]|nr:30S ribosomal protein S17 [Candidatus Saccharimonadales bacterium]